jgi:hypothetical protein
MQQRLQTQLRKLAGEHRLRPKRRVSRPQQAWLHRRRLRKRWLPCSKQRSRVRTAWPKHKAMHLSSMPGPAFSDHNSV